jgi:glyoxalase family protein
MKPTPLPFSGPHHVSALTKDAARNHAFYTRVLGLRLVKKTVNQDEPKMYHLFYGDGAGSPGSELTFFELPHAAREKRGVNSVTRTALRFTGASVLRSWEARLTSFGVAHGSLTERDGRLPRPRGPGRRSAVARRGWWHGSARRAQPPDGRARPGSASRARVQRAERFRP